jgi:hypothetical protein
LADGDAVTVFQVDARVLAECALFRGFAFFAPAAFFPVHLSAVEATEITQGGLGWAGFEQEVVAGNLRIPGNAKVAIRHSAEQEGVMLGEGKGLRGAVGAAELEVDGGHGVNAEMKRKNVGETPTLLDYG